MVQSGVQYTYGTELQVVPSMYRTKYRHMSRVCGESCVTCIRIRRMGHGGPLWVYGFSLQLYACARAIARVVESRDDRCDVRTSTMSAQCCPHAKYLLSFATWGHACTAVGHMPQQRIRQL